MDNQPRRTNGTQEFFRTLTGVLIVLVVFYSGLLLFFISGPPMEDIEDLRKIVFVVLLLGIVASGMLVFLGLPMFSIGPVDEPVEVTAPAPAMDEDEVLPEEYLGLTEEAAAQEAEGVPSEPQPGAADAYGQQATSCQRCGSPLIEGSRFCHSCGARVAHDGAPAGRRRQRKRPAKGEEGQA